MDTCTITRTHVLSALQARLELDLSLGAGWLPARALPSGWPACLAAQPRPAASRAALPRPPAPKPAPQPAQAAAPRLRPKPPLLVMPIAPAAVPDKDARMAPLADLAQNCSKCRLCATRQTMVWGEGWHDAKVMFVGEGPGATEDAYGRPFVGDSGHLLTNIIEKGLGIPRKQVYIANAVKCRPERNRDPKEDEVSACLPWLNDQIDIIAPAVLVAVGRIAANMLLGRPLDSRIPRGEWHEYRGIPMMTLYHPSYLLRQGRDTPEGQRAYRTTWEDVKLIKTRLGLDPKKP